MENSSRNILNQIENHNKELFELLTNFEGEIIAFWTDEFMDILTAAPIADYKEPYIHDFLYKNISDSAIQKSFSRKLIVVYDEAITTEIITSIHNWFYKNSCNIKNIIFISTCTINLSDWYKDFCQLNLQSGFKIIDATAITYWKMALLEQLEKTNFSFSKFANIDCYFSCYGGLYGSPERDLIISAVAQYRNIGHVEYLGGYFTDNQSFDNYLEQQTEFVNRKLCDQLLENKRKNIFTNNLIRLNEKVDLTFSHQVTNSFAVIIRETLNFLPFLLLTEKTFKVMLNCRCPMPLGYRAVSELKKIGFKFDDKLIDYSYENEKLLINRVVGAADQIVKLSQEYTLHELAELMHQSESLQYNYEYIISKEFSNTIKRKVVTELYE